MKKRTFGVLRNKSNEMEVFCLSSCFFETFLFQYLLKKKILGTKITYSYDLKSFFFAIFTA